MAIKQLSVYLENKQGSISDITDILAENCIDLRSMCIADTSEFGILRIIAENVEAAAKLLNEAGHTATVREVVAFAVPDEAGGLARVLRILDESGVNMEYMYALLTNEVGKAYIVMRVDDNKKTESILTENGIEVLFG